MKTTTQQKGLVIKKNDTLHDKKYLVLLADRKKVGLFTFVKDQIGEYKYVTIDDVPQNVRANERDFYGRSNIIFRHIEDHLHRHLKKVAGIVEEFAHGKHIDHVLIGGHPEMFEKIKKHLPKNLKDKVIGEFVTELNIPIAKVFVIAKKYVNKVQIQNETDRLQKVLKGN